MSTNDIAAELIAKHDIRDLDDADWALDAEGYDTDHATANAIRNAIAAKLARR